MTETGTLNKALRPARIGPLTVHWLRYLLPLLLAGLAVHLLLPQLANLHDRRGRRCCRCPGGWWRWPSRHRWSATAAAATC